MLKNNENPFFIKQKTINIIQIGILEMNNTFDIYSLQKNKNIIYLCGTSLHDEKN